MSIDIKQEETLKLQEYITMEKEKLFEARIKFQEDCDRFNKFVIDVEGQSEHALRDREEAVKEKERLVSMIDDLES